MIKLISTAFAVSSLILGFWGVQGANVLGTGYANAQDTEQQWEEALRTS